MSKSKGFPVKAVATHPNLHFDEILGLWMLRKFGQEKYPGIETAEILDCCAGGEEQEQSTIKWEAEGVLSLGALGGRFDEHPGPTTPGAQGKCASDMVAEDLGITDDPVLQPLLKFAHNADLKAVGHPMDLACIVKKMHAIYPNNLGKVIEWTFMGIEASYQQQLEFCKALRLLDDGTARTRIIKMSDKMTLVVVTCQTANRQFSKAAREKGAAVIIQQQPSGNVQIYTNHKMDVDLEDVARMIRLEEQEAQGQVHTTDWKELSREGKIAGWYYHHEGQMLFNGSLSAKEASTKLSLETIQKIVCIGLDPNAFEPSRVNTCRQGICNATAQNICSWYDLGLRRCRTIRFNQKTR